MDRNQPPDEEPLDARERLDIQSLELTPEELQQVAELVRQAHGPGELVRQAHGDAPLSNTSEGPDRVTLAIAGGILIGAILATRVTRAGPFEFGEAMPDNLADVATAVSELLPS